MNMNNKNDTRNSKEEKSRMSRRTFLRLGLAGGGALVLGTAGALANADRLQQIWGQAEVEPDASPSALVVNGTSIRLGATDGYIRLPADPSEYPAGFREVYVFGFVDMSTSDSINEAINTHKGLVQHSAPIIDVLEGDDVFVTLTNLGLVVRPDLDDAHTIHWHGFRNPVSVFDGVPETSISVPVGRNFPYFYKPLNPGTFMYHCHFEDTEHVQMGMDGVVFVRPIQNATGYPATGSNPGGGPGKYLYNDGDGSTAYDREYCLLLNEVDTRPHDNLENVQEFVWSDYKPNYWVINGRSYPDTIKPNIHPFLPHQPISSLIQANPGEKIALRLAHLGYEQHTMQMAGIPMKVVGHDAALLRNGSGVNMVDLSYYTNSIYIGPGEARDIIFEAPAFDPSAVAGTDTVGDYNVYTFKNRSFQKLNNNGYAPGMGGMMTEVRVYDDLLPDQSTPNQTF
ncbi:MAG: multicopper oxidase domain-containing protein [Ardenticatenaceae bacterium]|nr:multicopper oxidase domain-containing protein [Ardenticatenaceae bacterium]